MDFFVFIGLKSPISSFVHLDWAFSLNKVVRYEFSLGFPLLLLFFLSSSCCGVWLCRRRKVDLSVGFHVDNLDAKLFR